MDRLALCVCGVDAIHKRALRKKTTGARRQRPFGPSIFFVYANGVNYAEFYTLCVGATRTSPAFSGRDVSLSA